MKVLKGFLRALDYVEETCLVILLVVMTALNFANVFSRYLLSSSISYTEEITGMAFVWVSMLGSATAYKRGAHLGMSFIVEQFPKKGQAFFVLFSTICSVVMLSILFKYGVIMVQGQIALNSRTSALQWPSAMQGLSIPVGAVFMIIRSVQMGVTQMVRLWKEGGNKA